MKLIVATGNEGKMREIRAILAGTGLEPVSMKEAGIQVEIEENGSTFEENALIKARTLCRWTGEACLADDSGLEIDFLGGEPGVHSARFLGEDTSYEIKNSRILEMMKEAGAGERTARFVCVIACVYPDGRQTTVRKTMEGEIAHKAAGENGFGYDPIFYLPEYGCTSAQLSPEEKNRQSHRGKALRAFCEQLGSENALSGIEKNREQAEK